MSRAWNPFLRFPRAALALTGLLLLPLLPFALRLPVGAETRVLLAGDERNLAGYDQVRGILGENEVVLVSLEDNELFSAGGIARVRRVSDALGRIPDAIDVRSLTHAVKPVRTGLTFAMVPLVSLDPTPVELAALRRFCLGHPLVRNVMVAADGRHTLIMLTLRSRPGTADERRALRTAVDAVLEPFRAAGLRFQVLSLALIEEEVRDTLRRDLTRFLPATMLLVLGTFWLALRSVRFLALAVLNEALALVTLPGLLALAGGQLTLYSLLLLPLLAGAQLALMIHVFTAFQQALTRGASRDDALVGVLQLTFKPATFATLTTITGLLSLLTSDVPQVREFGRLGAIGMLVIHLLTYGPTLALLKLVGTGRHRESAGIGRPPFGFDEPSGAGWVWTDWLARFVQRWRAGVFVAMALAIVGAVMGGSLIRTDIRAVEFLGPRSPTRLAVEELDRVYGGINVVQIEFDTGVAGGANRLEFLRYLDTVQREAESQPGLSAAYSHAQLMSMIQQIWDGGAPAALRLPTNPLLLGLFTTALKSYDFPFLTGLADPTFRRAYLVVRTRDLPSRAYLDLVNGLVAFAQRTKPPDVTVSATAGIHSILEADRRIIRSQLNSAFLTLAAIGVMLALLWGSVRLAAIALLTIVVPVAFALGLAGVAGVPLNSVTVMAAAIALGIAVDDAIHLTTHWRWLRRNGLDPAAAVREALRVKGPPIVWTSVILVAVAGLFGCSSFPPVVAFGALTTLALAGALAAVLFFLPAVLCGMESSRESQPPAGKPES